MIILCIEMHILHTYAHTYYDLVWPNPRIDIEASVCFLHVVTEVFSLISGTLYSVDQRTRNLEPGDLKVHALLQLLNVPQFLFSWVVSLRTAPRGNFSRYVLWPHPSISKCLVKSLEKCQPAIVSQARLFRIAKIVWERD